MRSTPISGMAETTERKWPPLSSKCTDGAPSVRALTYFIGHVDGVGKEDEVKTDTKNPVYNRNRFRNIFIYIYIQARY